MNFILIIIHRIIYISKIHYKIPTIYNYLKHEKEQKLLTIMSFEQTKIQNFDYSEHKNE